MAREREPKVIWVDSWKDLPDGISGDWGAVTPKGVIYAIKGKTSKSDIAHEKGHITLGHYKKKLPTASGHIKEEIAATHWAYRKTGQPKHIYSILSGLYNDLARGDYYGTYTTPKQMLLAIKRVLSKYKIPIEWKNDYKKLVKAVAKIERWRT